MKKSITFAYVALATTLVSGCAMAQMRGRFDALDTNGSGYIEAPELTAARLKTFDRADANGDGVLTREEAEAARDAMRRQAFGEDRDAFGMADRDDDGRILRSDVEEARPFLIEAADSNEDGRLSKGELRDYFKQFRNAR